MIKTQKKADLAIRIIDKAFPKHGRDCGFFQNKRKGHRDLKWDYLSQKKAEKVAWELRAHSIAHVHRVIETSGPFGDSHAQIRLEVPLDFSVGDARSRNRGGLPRKKAGVLSKRQRFSFEKSAALKSIAALTFKHPDALRIASAVNRVFTQFEGIEI